MPYLNTRLIHCELAMHAKSTQRPAAFGAGSTAVFNCAADFSDSLDIGLKGWRAEGLLSERTATNEACGTVTNNASIVPKVYGKAHAFQNTVQIIIIKFEPVFNYKRTNFVSKLMRNLFVLFSKRHTKLTTLQISILSQYLYFPSYYTLK